MNNNNPETIQNNVREALTQGIETLIAAGAVQASRNDIIKAIESAKHIRTVLTE